ncbi:MAG: hypothetical protein LBU80_06290 [Rikenellaceae bacterium]|jgi:hypothetical protein|nr:hypothetical protein [Rikenellaceae bacterium]
MIISDISYYLTRMLFQKFPQPADFLLPPFSKPVSRIFSLPPIGSDGTGDNDGFSIGRFEGLLTKCPQAADRQPEAGRAKGFLPLF